MDRYPLNIIVAFNHNVMRSRNCCLLWHLCIRSFAHMYVCACARLLFSKYICPSQLHLIYFALFDILHVCIFVAIRSMPHFCIHSNFCLSLAPIMLIILNDVVFVVLVIASILKLFVGITYHFSRECLLCSR